MTSSRLITVAEPNTDETRARDQIAVEHEISELYQAAKSRIKVLAEGYSPDLQPVGFSILRFVFDNQPVRAQAITAALGMDKGAVSRQVTQLRELGLVETQPDPEDRRAVRLVASDAAMAKREEYRTQSRIGYGRIFADWADGDVSDLARLLKKFNGSL